MGRIVVLLAALLCGAIALAAAEQYTYKYTGPAFSVGPDHVEVTFNTSAPLAASTTYLTSAAAGVIWESIVVIGSSGAIDGLTLPISTFQVRTGSDASSSVPGIVAWNIVGDISALTGTAPAQAGDQYQVSTTNTVTDGTDISATASDIDQAKKTTFYSSDCTGTLGCTSGLDGQFYVATYSGSIDPGNSGASNWALLVTVSGILPDGIVGIAYTGNGLTVTGGDGQYTWSATYLPDGLTIDSATGVVSGIPTTHEDYDVVVTVTDGSGQTDSITVLVDIEEPLYLKGYLKIATVNAYYKSEDIKASGGAKPYTFTATGLPPGLTISATGFVSGTPTTIATYTVKVTVTDGMGTIVTKDYTLDVKTSLRLTGSLRNGTVGNIYRYSEFRVSGGVAPYVWSAADLPTGLSIDSATGVVSGTPSARGPFPSAVTVTDAIGIIGSRATVLVMTVVPLQITGGLRSGTLGAPYSAGSEGVRATGGIPPRAWAATGLPTGLTIDAATGVISGTPMAGGSYSVNFTVVDSATPTATTVTKTVPLTITTPSLQVSGYLPPGDVDTAYSSGGIYASGGAPPYTYSATGLPAGFTISSSTGVISGTTSAADSYNVVVTAVDSDSPPSSRTKSSSLVIRPAMAITGYIRNGTVGSSYESEELRASGGVAPYTWSASGFPAGLTFSSSTGELTGRATEAGTFTVEVNLTDSRPKTATRTFTNVVFTAVPLALSGSLRGATVGVPYNSSDGIRVTGGVPPYNWEAPGLPAGLTISATTGFITGTALAGGSFTVSVTVNDKDNINSATKAYSLSVTVGSFAISGTLPGGSVGVAYSGSLTGSGGTPPYTWSATGLPDGTSIDGSTGLITGTPNIQGTFTPTVTLKDSSVSQQTKTSRPSVVITNTATPAYACTKPSGASSLEGKQYITAVGTTTITVNTVTVLQVPSCTSIEWKGASKFVGGQRVEYKGYRIGTILVATRISLSS
eukprot:jgi/Mesvir1/18887/Mv18886-RA.1